MEGKEKVTITVNLAAGDHFLFSCHNDLYADYIYSSPGTFTDLCAEIPKLQQINPPTDNYEFLFKPESSAGKVTVHVLDSYYHFNITRSMTFEDITFRGESALAARADPSTTPTYPPLATIAIPKCSV